MSRIQLCGLTIQYLGSVITLVIHANAAGVETDVMLIFVALVLHDTEQHTILHLQPEFTMFVF